VSSPASSPEGKVASNKLKLGVLFRVGSSEDCDTQFPGEEGPQLDHQSIPTPVLCPLVASVSRSLRPRGPDRCVQKKEGGTCSPQVLEDSEKVLAQAHQMSVRILPVFISTGENILADIASRFQKIPDWQFHSSVFRAISAKWGLPTTDLFASNASKQTTLLQLGRIRQPRRRRRALPVRLLLRPCIFTNLSPQESSEETGDFERLLHPGLSPLGSPDVASFASDAKGVGGLPTTIHGQPSDGSDDGRTAPNPSQPSSSCLEDLWRLNHLQDLPSDTSDLHKAGPIRKSLAVFQRTSSFLQRFTQSSWCDSRYVLSHTSPQS
jgi:hypothetical protein